MACLAGLPALLAVHRLLRTLDPDGLELALQAPQDAPWQVTCRGAGAARASVVNRARIADLLWLELRADSGRVLRSVVVFRDALANDDWRRLRRQLRVAGRSTGHARNHHGAGDSTVSIASGRRSG